MTTLDLNYICSSIGNLSGIPVRLYENNQELHFFSMVKLPKDPMIIYKEKILSISDRVSYFATENLNYYGIFNLNHKKIILGPTRLVPNSEQDLHEMALRMDLPQDEITEFITGMKSIVGLPVERLLQMLCLLNYFFHNEKINLADIAIYEAQQNIYNRDFVEESSNELMEFTSKTFYRRVHNTYLAESTMVDIINKGDINALNAWVNAPAAVQSSLLASDPIRQRKNTFISTATLASRAAIQGGMSPNDALSLADAYIQKCELQRSPEAITNLQYHMIMNFTEKVNQLRLGGNPSKLIMDVINYIQQHLSTAITTQEIADALFLSRPYLSFKFKEETGQTLSDFITQYKINEAIRLLKYSNKPILSIAVYLGFSSQSHFTRVFKKSTGKTPGEYR